VRLITLDFETYYDRQYSLRKLTTEEYVRDERFEVIGLAIKIDSDPTTWIEGTAAVQGFLSEADFSDCIILCHNTMFDGAILNWHYGVKPLAWFDTLCMARALHGTEQSASLKNVAERYGVGVKGEEVQNTMGKRLDDFTREELDRFADYAINDVDLTYEVFKYMQPTFPQQELELIDLTLRMYIEPTLRLDLSSLQEHLSDTRMRKLNLLKAANVSREELMSNQKFAVLLENLGVKPPMKTSPRTGKKTFAFAKSDEGLKALVNHKDERVRNLVSARLGTKSTLEETRTERFIGIGQRGPLPVPVRYYAAHTGRWGGDDKINLQNLPSRGPNGKKLKSSIIAPEGYTLIDADSSQIEARVLAWLSEQDDLVSQFANGEDVYIKMASSIYDVPEDQVTKDQRFVGKTTILGAGYGMGYLKFGVQLKTFGYEVAEAEAKRIISVYRETYPYIPELWQQAGQCIKDMHGNKPFRFGRKNVLGLDVEENAIVLPSKLKMFYNDLHGVTEENRTYYSYKTREGRTRIYGGKVVENVCQAIARCIIGEQMLKIAERYRVVLTVHDSIVCCVKNAELTDAKVYVESCMRETPEWATDLPIDCESGVGVSYGECE
jgi:DNA polymerase